VRFAREPPVTLLNESHMVPHCVMASEATYLFKLDVILSCETDDGKELAEHVRGRFRTKTCKVNDTSGEWFKLNEVDLQVLRKFQFIHDFGRLNTPCPYVGSTVQLKQPDSCFTLLLGQQKHSESREKHNHDRCTDFDELFNPCGSRLYPDLTGHSCAGGREEGIPSPRAEMMVPFHMSLLFPGRQPVSLSKSKGRPLLQHCLQDEYDFLMHE
jgi:hypothetical protein